MMLNCYSIYDLKALQYHPPFYASTDAQAMRSMADLANDLNTNVGRHPADYVLYCVGTYNDQNGQLQPLTPLRHVADAWSLVKQAPELFPVPARGTPREYAGLDQVKQK